MVPEWNLPEYGKRKSERKKGRRNLVIGFQLFPERECDEDAKHFVH